VAGGPEQPDFSLNVPNIATSTDPSFSSLDFSPTSQFIVSGAWDNKGRVWELSRDGSGRYGPGSTGMRAEVDMGGPLLDVKWSQWEATKVYAVGCNKMLRTWDLNTNQLADLGQVSSRGRLCVAVCAPAPPPPSPHPLSLLTPSPHFSPLLPRSTLSPSLACTWPSWAAAPQWPSLLAGTGACASGTPGRQLQPCPLWPCQSASSAWT
jgi:WD40 repeat protein